MTTLTLSNSPRGTKEVFEYLCHCAKNMYTDNYQNICAEVDRRSGGAVKIIPVAIGPSLGWIRDQCIDQNVPWLNALAVRLSDWRPGEAFLPGGTKWEHSHEHLWRGMVLQAFSYDWTSITVA